MAMRMCTRSPVTRSGGRVRDLRSPSGPLAAGSQRLGRDCEHRDGDAEPVDARDHRDYPHFAPAEMASTTAAMTAAFKPRAMSFDFMSPPSVPASASVQRHTPHIGKPPGGSDT